MQSGKKSFANTVVLLCASLPLFLFNLIVSFPPPPPPPPISCFTCIPHHRWWLPDKAIYYYSVHIAPTRRLGGYVIRILIHLANAKVKINLIKKKTCLWLCVVLPRHSLHILFLSLSLSLSLSHSLTHLQVTVKVLLFSSEPLIN